jgi:hypothetical protein
LETTRLSAYLVIFFLVSAIICAPVGYKTVSFVSQQAIAQPMAGRFSPVSSHGNTSTTNNSFLTYQNKSALGIVIQYPFNWKRIEADHKALIFLPPSKKDAFSEKITVAVFGINSTISTAQLSSAAINNYGQQYKDFFIINSKPITLGGNPAYMLSYTYSDPGIGTISAMDIGVKDLNKAYIISYSAQSQEYHTYVPAVQKMIQSFHVIPT